MLSEALQYSLEEVQAYRTYFAECRDSATGTLEFNDLDVTVTLCDQLLAWMTSKEPQEE